MGDIFQQTYSKPYDMGQPILNGGYYYSPSGRLCPRHLFSCFTSVSSFRHAIHISQWPGHVHGGHRAAHRPRLGPAAAPSQGGSRPVSHPALSPSLRWQNCFLEFLFLEKNIPGPSGAATTAMFLPTAGSAAAAQAAAVASVTQQQLQLQTAAATAAHINSINNVAAAAQVIPGFTCFCFSTPKYFGQI